MRRKVYGQSRVDECVFCGVRAFSENSQGFMTCKDHKNSIMEDKNCLCGEFLDVKKSKWGAFFVCPNCGPMSLKKVEEMIAGNYNLNKKFRKKETYDKDKVYTLEELEQLWSE